MVIDHVGVIFFPDAVELRFIGRLAMPLFAYSIARGFYFSFNKGTFAKYKKRMIIFTLFSQIPYTLMVKDYSGNIGVLWLICLLFLESAEKEKKTVKDYLIIYFVVICAAIIPTGYGIYGLGFTLIFYYFAVKNDYNLTLYIGYAVIHIIRILQDFQYGAMQLFTLTTLPLINILKKYDNKIKLNKWFFYIFYPAHIIVLLIIKQLIK
jgi:hypothetical protein